MAKKILIFTPMGIEFYAVRRALGLRTRISRGAGGLRVCAGTYCGREIALARTGMGKKRTVRAAETLLGEGGISLLVVAGVAGAAAAHLRAGDVVLPAKVAELSGGKTHIAALHLAGRGFAARPPVHAGGIAYTAHRVCGAGDKAVLRERDPGAAIVDMESFHACEAAARRGVPCLVVRGVSDTADFCFPKIVVADRKSLRDVFGNFPWNPAELVRLVRLWRDCDAAAANMAAVLACVLKDIVI